MPPSRGITVRRRRTTIYLTALVGSILVFSVLYWRGMAIYEDTQKTYLQSLQVVVETYTTAGYGSDTPWTSTEMNLFVMAMNTVGTIMIFLALPVFLTPTLRRAVERTPPTSLDHTPTEHVVLASKSPRMAELTTVLDDRGVDYVVVESDEETAMSLYDDGEAVVHGQPDELAGLEAANLREARALVADVEDRRDASIVLTAREIQTDEDADLRIVSVVDEPDRVPYHRLAGADAVVSPRPVVGARLAEMATAAVRSDLGEGVAVGDQFQAVELPVAQASDLHGQTVAGSGLHDLEDAYLAAMWHDGEFQCPVADDAQLRPGTVLLVVGTGETLPELAERAMGRPPEAASSETIVVGYGEVGQAVTDTLEKWDLPYTVVDLEDREGVDVVGDATEPDTLDAAGIHEADAIVLAIPDDVETEFATLVARDCNDQIHLAARADDDAAVRRLYRAGADYVLPVDAVTGRLLGGTVLDDDHVLAADTRVEVVDVDGALAGTGVADAEERLEAGSAIVALERDGAVHLDLDDGVALETGDRLVLVGTDQDLAAFTEGFA